MRTIPQDQRLVQELMKLLAGHRDLWGQERVYQRMLALVMAEIMAFGRHTITQLLMGLGEIKSDWSAWYRLYSRGRFNYEKASERVFQESLQHVGPEELYVVGGDGTQTPRSSRKMEGVGWLRNLRSPAFKVGIHLAQRWFNGSWFLPAEAGYSRALPLRWMPAFTPKSKPRLHEPRSESQAALDFLNWLKKQMAAAGRESQRILMLGDGSYDHLELWKALPQGIILCARSAKNRALYHLPENKVGQRGRKRLYGERAESPQEVWQAKGGWQSLSFLVRGRERHLQVRLCGPFLRKGAPHCPLFLIVVRGKDNQRVRRQPLPFLVNALANETGDWTLPLPLETLLFWTWQRWELEVAHRELKTTFGLGHKQCWNPLAAVLSVQWSAWLYSLLLLAGYRSWGLTRGPQLPSRWWRGSARWSLATLWRSFRATLWGEAHFYPLFSSSSRDWSEKETLLLALRHSIFAASFS